MKIIKHEITAIPALLELIDIQGAVITIDAMGTQTEIVRLICAKKADYVLALKTNHPTLHQEVKNWFDTARASNFEGIKFSHDRRVEKGHHRTEKRLVWAVPLSEFGGQDKQEQWSGLQTIVMIERTRSSRGIKLPMKSSIGCLLYHQTLLTWVMQFALIGELKTKSIGREDVTFNEDHCRIRSGNSPRNLAQLRRMALNALNQEKSLKRSLRQKMNRAAMNNDYLMTVLQSFCQ